MYEIQFSIYRSSADNYQVVNRVSNFFRKNDYFLMDPHFWETIRYF